MNMKTYDGIVIGGGPAGLSAAIYMGRFNRSVLILDKCEGRWQSREVNENYFGFPDGVPARALVFKGRQQAEKYGADFIETSVYSIERDLEADFFKVMTVDNEVFLAKTVLFATGVRDHWPQFENFREYIGQSLFWCITCDGHKVINKRVGVVGANDDAAVTCLQFLQFTEQLFFITNVELGKHNISFEKQQLLKKYNIPFNEGVITGVEGEDGWMQRVILSSGETHHLDFMFSEQGGSPSSELAITLGVKTNEEKYINVNEEQRTNVPFVYAAGDVTRIHSHQIVTAAHEGAQAAQAMNYDLYSPDQRQ